MRFRKRIFSMQHAYKGYQASGYQGIMTEIMCVSFQIGEVRKEGGVRFGKQRATLITSICRSFKIFF